MMPRLICLVLMLLSSSVYAACTQPIKMAALSWESGQFTTAVIKQILQQAYGCEVIEVSGSSSAQENALIQNDLQLIAEIWQGRSTVLADGLKSNQIQVFGNTLAGGATQGWYIPRYLAEQYPDLRHYQDLFRYPSLFQAQFQSNTDAAKGRFLTCPKGWVCEGFNQRLLHNTGLNQHYSIVQPGTGAALDAEISAYYEQKKPVLFYYWQPAGLMAKYDFVPLRFPSFNAQCWDQLVDKTSKDPCISGFPVSQLSIAASNAFVKQHPELVEMLKKIQFSPEQLNGAILSMNENQRSATDQANLFMLEHPAQWQAWLSPTAIQQMQLQQTAPKQQDFFPKWDMQDQLNQQLKHLVVQFSDPLRQFSAVIEGYFISPVLQLLTVVPAWAWILLTGALAWYSSRNWGLSLMSMLGLFLIGALGLWTALLETCALLFCSVLLTLLIGIPVGIWVGLKPRAYKWIQPLLDVMQTMPSFVYLIPILMLFGLGHVPALFATLIYAIAPLIRLTALGIQQVNPSLIEAGSAFGSSPRQLLFWIILPQARPSILAGLNQTIMMSLSMVVLASMIGAPGLGEYVLESIQTLNVGQGIQSGLSIVILAIIIDRISQAYGRTTTTNSKH
ncbi:glycine betaine/proline transport system substrate-binding protein [Acinetobacter calcoaceticus]|uniref:Glycine betaine/proline transport system substrate-binding protein n=1 Tax=Acinetobacter calcoaceticus TaxID=471 RepID=A0A4R1Y9T6_ACICA|nr:glycine betaine/proline transport system substrate-binding protein [Acinetobacter calcoaceticus]